MEQQNEEDKLREEDVKKLHELFLQREMDKYEYALFLITDREKFVEFMLKYLTVSPKETEAFGYRVQVLGCGKDPFEMDSYLDYLAEVKALDPMHPFYLDLSDWVRMGRPEKGSKELSDKIEDELS